MAESPVKVHSPLWKSRVPRDLGAGWDFDDVRDHYFRVLFGLDPLDVRYSDHERYLELSRVVTGEVMAATFREWRRARSTCHGALIWFWRDLWLGAGWGIVDSSGAPKSAWYFLKRILQPRTVFFTDESGNGLSAHVANEAAEPLQATLQVALYRSGRIPVGNKTTAVTVAPRECVEIPVVQLLDGFMDLTYTYRFGPPSCDLVVGTLTREDGAVLARDFFFPLGPGCAVESDLGLTASAQTLPNGDVDLLVRSERAARFVTVRTPGFRAEDQYFHLAPGGEHPVRLQRLQAESTLRGEVRALNSAVGCKILSTA
jgi:beta-mannosidase